MRRAEGIICIDGAGCELGGPEGLSHGENLPVSKCRRGGGYGEVKNRARRYDRSARRNQVGGEE